MEAVARVIAVENQMQYSVLRTSLSIVLGMPITFTPSFSTLGVVASVPSPPIVIR